MEEDYDYDPITDCYMNYYYYIPCPTSSWFWGLSGWEQGDIVGAWFTIGDLSMFSGAACDPFSCLGFAAIRVLDFAGYGTAYPGLFTVRFDVYCADADGCPVGPPLWTSGPRETHYGWNRFWPSYLLSLSDCLSEFDPVASYPRFLVTATHTGSDGSYPRWGADAPGLAYDRGCDLHDYSCYPALYPRPASSHFETMHSGYYGKDFEYYHPQWFRDGLDSTPDCSRYGYVELAWRIDVPCVGHIGTEPTTWGTIKSLYK
jgi:hypothetical protein